MSEMPTPDVIKLEQEWRLGKLLAAGGFAKVYMAMSKSDAPAVVKLIPKTPGAQRELLLENLNSVPNVVPVLESGEWDGYWVLVMPRAEKSLRAHLREMGGRLSVDAVIQVLVDITEALVAMEGNIVHRDIKPENVLLLDGRWCLADFGIARYAEATTAPDTHKYSKTPPYAAPEQWREERASSFTDVYALGVMTYEMLAGQRPFAGPDVHDYRTQHLEVTPQPIEGILASLRSLVNECLYKGPQARPGPQNLLARLKASAQPASPAALGLQIANALAVERQAEEARQQSVAQSEAERRLELCKAADQSLEHLYGLLNEQIRSNASLVQSSTNPIGAEYRLNGAALTLGLRKTVAPRSNEDRSFEVIAHTCVTLTIRPSGFGWAGRSHSLWFCDAQQPGVFRWYETAFMIPFGGTSRNGLVPFDMVPGDPNAIQALAPVTHSHQVAWPFTPIDQGDEESFIERWMEWFAKAAQGQLRRPSRLPESNPQGSWRR